MGTWDASPMMGEKEKERIKQRVIFFVLRVGKDHLDGLYLMLSELSVCWF